MTTASNDFGPRGFALKPLHLIGVAIIVMAIAMGYSGLRTAFRPYTTSVSEAIRSGRSVQLAGFLYPPDPGSYDADGNFAFSLQDSSGKVVKVVYTRPKPANFEQAVSLVAIGRHDMTKGVFLADDMLVKCPSKYQEQFDQGGGR